MSFAIYIPQRTDARLIAPELDKLINAPGSQTAGMVRLITMEHLNGILAISAQSQYLDDVRRWVEVLDREGENAERRLFVYRVQNGRAIDLTKVLDGAFGLAAPKGGEDTTINDAGINSGGSSSSEVRSGSGNHQFSVTGTGGAQGGSGESRARPSSRWAARRARVSSRSARPTQARSWRTTTVRVARTRTRTVRRSPRTKPTTPSWSSARRATTP